MSRGPGKVMRFVLEHLRDDVPVTVGSLASDWRHEVDCGCGDRDENRCGYLGQPTRADLVSIRRAIHSLANAGEVERFRVRQHWDEGPRHLGVKRCQDRTTAGVDNTYCWRCNRPIRDITPVGSSLGHQPAGGQFECTECTSGKVNALALVAAGFAAGLGDQS